MFKRLAGTFRSSARNTSRRPANDARLTFQSLEDRRLLAVITVNSLADNFALDGNVSLREAVQAANTDTSVDGSVAGSGADTINFSAALSGQTITLAGLEIAITEALTIDATGLANDLTIDANELSRIFNITAATGDFQFNGLTLTGGKTTGDNVDFSDNTYNGGAIRSLTTGNLTLNGSTITGNSTVGFRANGGGVYARGDVTLTGSTFSGNSTSGTAAIGGGVIASGDITLTGSTFSGNSTSGTAASGGGLFASGDVTLTGSTFNGNSTAGNSADGGGVIASGDITLTGSTVSGNSTAGAFAQGGGISARYGNVTLTSSTVSGNSTTGYNADGGGVFVGSAGGFSIADVTISLSTVTNNEATHATSTGGGVWNGGSSLLIDSSIVAGNTAGDGSNDIRSTTGTFTVNFSLLGTGVTPGAGSGNLFNNNPLLGPLANNGGPTETHAVLAGSLAIDAGSPAAMAPYDQRGEPFLRIVDGRVDIGAYERQSVAGLNLEVDTTIDENDGDYSAGDLSLREAVGLANGSLGAETITFATALSGQAITLGGAELEITEAVTIDAAALAANVTIDAQELSRIFNITAPNGDFQFNGLTLTGGKTTGSDSFLSNTHRGGAIRSLTAGNLTLDGSTITGNSTAGSSAVGGGVAAGGNVTLTGSTVSGNSTAGNFADGGGVFALGSITLTSSTVSGNSTPGFSSKGGGVFAFGNVTLSQSTVTSNEATSTGGGIWNDNNNTILIDGSIVAGNTAGGGMNDVAPGTGTFSVNFSLIGSGVTPDAGTSGNNVVTNNPMLGSLADNGGPTLTHALLPGSPAIDAGNNALAVDAGGNPLLTDQRGVGFGRIIDGDNNGTATVDIGAFEFGSEFLLGDVNQDGAVNFLDINPFIAVLSAGVFQAEADCDLSGTVDFLDIDPFIVLLSSPPTAAASAQFSAAPSNATEPLLQFGDGNSVQLIAAPSEPSLLAFTGVSQMQNRDGSHRIRNERPVWNGESVAKQLSHRETDSLAEQERSYDSGSGDSSLLDVSAEPVFATSSADLFDNHPELIEGLAASQLDEVFEELLI